MTQPTPPEQAPVEAYTAKRDLLHDRRALALIGGGLVVVAAVGFFVVKPLLHKSSSSDATGTVANAHVHPATATSASPTPTATAAPTPAPKLVVRDPFSPLYVAPSGGSGSGASAAPSASASAGSTTPITQVSTVIVPEPGPTVTKTVGASAKYTLTAGTIVYSATASGQEAIVTLNGKKYTVHKSEYFPSATEGPFELESVSPGSGTSSPSATFLYGDDTFSMHQGDTIREY